MLVLFCTLLYVTHTVMIILCFIMYRQLLERKKLDAYLSSALNVPLINGRLQDIDEESYVLTVDYTIKVLLYIHTYIYNKFCCDNL